MTQEERNQLYLDSFRNAKAEATQALKARDEAQTRLDRANLALRAWETIVGQAGLDISPDPKPVRPEGETNYGQVKEKPRSPHAPSHPFSKSTGTIKNGGGSRPTVAVVDDDPPANKADFVRRAIRNAGEDGISTAEIRASAIKSGIEVYAGYPYTVLHKMRGRKEIVSNTEGRWVTNVN